VQFDGGFAEHVLTAKRMEARHVESGATATAAGTIAIVDGGPRLDLAGHWEQFRWPLTGRDIPVHSTAGTFTLQGVLPYRVHVTGDIRAAGLPAMPVDVYGTLGKDRFGFERAEVDLYGGHASASGEVVWSGPGSWTVSGRATGINPGLLRPTCPAAELQLHELGERVFHRRQPDGRLLRAQRPAARRGGQRRRHDRPQRQYLRVQ
jgi:autotransporter translocation and assembly factor TamB